MSQHQKPSPKKPTRAERIRAARDRQPEKPPTGRQSNRGTKIAVTKEERHRVTLLRRALPNPVPEAWHSVHEGIKRMSPYEQDGTFCCVFEGRGMRLAYTVTTKDAVVITLSRVGGLPTPKMIEQAKADFFPGQKVQAKAPIPGLVYLVPEA